MVPPLPDTVAEKTGSIYKSGTGDAAPPNVVRAAFVRLTYCRTGKPAGRLLAIVRSTVTPDVTLLVTPFNVRSPLKPGAVSGSDSVPLELTGTVVSTENGTPATLGAAVAAAGTEALGPPPHPTAQHAASKTRSARAVNSENGNCKILAISKARSKRNVHLNSRRTKLEVLIRTPNLPESRIQNGYRARSCLGDGSRFCNHFVTRVPLI
jgi:hypothetical protein